MAEKEGFEPSIGVNPYNRLATCRLQPLGHLSMFAQLRSIYTATHASPYSPASEVGRSPYLYFNYQKIRLIKAEQIYTLLNN